jgi:D-glycero-alpha-D-manno-heptose 1-phosphate guanylyltransferase
MTNILDDVTAVILAGGLGTRLLSLYPDVPKPMIPVGGRPFLYWLTAWLASQGLTHFVYSTGHRAEQIESWCEGDDFPELTRLCRRETEPLGTGGGLLNCLDLCRDYVLVANGDGLIMDGINALLSLRHVAHVDGGLIGVAVEDATRYGSLAIGEGGQLIGFREKIPGRGVANGGFYLFRTALLREHYRPGRLSIEYELIPRIIEARASLRVVCPVGAAFIDIGTPESLSETEHFVKTHLGSIYSHADLP